jgi:hypothetical protein
MAPQDGGKTRFFIQNVRGAELLCKCCPGEKSDEKAAKKEEYAVFDATSKWYVDVGIPYLSQEGTKDLESGDVFEADYTRSNKKCDITYKRFIVAWDWLISGLKDPKQVTAKSGSEWFAWSASLTIEMKPDEEPRVSANPQILAQPSVKDIPQIANTTASDTIQEYRKKDEGFSYYKSCQEAEKAYAAAIKKAYTAATEGGR